MTMVALRARAQKRIGLLSGVEVRIAIFFFLGAVLQRLPFLSRILYHWDSVNFVFALKHFDIAHDQPQPPGYIVYVWLGRVVEALMGHPQRALVTISVVASGLAIAALYALGQEMFNRRVGIVAALFMASSPLFWFYGEIALPHTVDTLLVILSVWTLYRLAQSPDSEEKGGRQRALWASAAILALAGGLRQQTIVFLAPVALYAGWQGTIGQLGWRDGLRRAIPAIALCALLCLLWFVPLIQLSGGLTRYREVVGDFSTRFNATTSLLMGAGTTGLIRNLRKLGMYTLYGWGLAVVPFVLWLLAQVINRRRRLNWDRVIFIILWVLPGLVFYTIIHMGQQGLVFIFLPALLLVSAAGLVELVAHHSLHRLSIIVSILVLINATIFVLMPEHPLGDDRFKLLTRQTIDHNDAYFRERIEAVRREFSPEDTAIIAANWRHVEFYLPEYPLVRFSLVSKWEVGEGRNLDRAGEYGRFTTYDLGVKPEANVILFDPDLHTFNHTPDQTQSFSLESGALVHFMPLGPHQSLQINAAGFDLVSEE